MSEIALKIVMISKDNSEEIDQNYNEYIIHSSMNCPHFVKVLRTFYLNKLYSSLSYRVFFVIEMELCERNFHYTFNTVSLLFVLK